MEYLFPFVIVSCGFSLNKFRSNSRPIKFHKKIHVWLVVNESVNVPMLPHTYRACSDLVRPNIFLCALCNLFAQL
jgi:hypothetical protein